MTTTRIGEIEITPLSDGELRIPPEGLLNKAADQWPPGFLDADRLMGVNFGGFLVRAPGHLVVVDTGIGGGALPELAIGSLPSRLADAGVEPSDVDVVIFTHLHFDHVGWSTDGKQPLFSAAEHHAHAIDWAYYFGPDPHEETGPGREDFGAIPAPERLAPLADTIVLHRAQRTEIVPGVTLRLAPGHTPGTASSRSRRAANGRSCSPTPRTIPRSSRPTAGTRSPTSTPSSRSARARHWRPSSPTPGRWSR